MGKSEERSRSEGEWIAAALIDEVGDDAGRREFWLVSPAALRGLRSLARDLPGGGKTGEFALEELDQSDLSEEAWRASERIKVGKVWFAGCGGWPPQSQRARAWTEKANALREEFRRLALDGEALGQAELEIRADGKMYEFDAALACAALKERWELEGQGRLEGGVSQRSRRGACHL